MLLGKAGVTSIPVGGKSFPTGMFASLLGQLASQAAAEYDEAVAQDLAGVPGYLLREDGEFAIEDIADSVARNGLLLSHIETLSFTPDAAAEEGYDETDDGTLDDDYDALEPATLMEFEESDGYADA